MSACCNTCGHAHPSNDARAIGRFSGAPRFVAANAGTPPRATRAEAEADECAWRAAGRRLARETAPSLADRTPTLPSHPEPAPVQPFPAGAMETLARAKAWRDFLAQARLSLTVWEIDPAVRAECDHVLDWLRSCRDDLLSLLDKEAA